MDIQIAITMISEETLDIIEYFVSEWNQKGPIEEWSFGYPWAYKFVWSMMGFELGNIDRNKHKLVHVRFFEFHIREDTRSHFEKNTSRNFFERMLRKVLL